MLWWVVGFYTIYKPTKYAFWRRGNLFQLLFAEDLPTALGRLSETIILHQMVAPVKIIILKATLLFTAD